MSEREQLRRERFIKTMEESKLDGYLIVDPTNVSYLTGFNGEDSYLWIGDSGVCLLSDTRFDEQIKQECPDVSALIRHSGQSTLGLLEYAIHD
ncbi:MAG: aminopeptidase P family N-terminal domain-containing protein, partial [Thermoguttaceae bacterium]